MNNSEILIPLGFFAMVVAIVYLALRQKERMTLIQRGLNPNDGSQGCQSVLQLKVGLLLIGLALGILLGDLLATFSRLEPWASHLSMIFIFTGISLVLGYCLVKKNPPNTPSQR